MTEPTDLAAAPEIVRSLYRVFTTRWPDFVTHAKLSASGDLRFDIPRDIPRDVPGETLPEPLETESLLVIADADLDEVIISFGGGHSHGGGWRTPEEPDFEFKATLRLVEEVLDERVLGFTTENGGGGMSYASDIASVEHVSRVRSWRGTYDLGV